MAEIVGTNYKQFVVFKIGKEEYGIETLKIRHIEEIMVTTRVPKTPPFIKGVINMRGEIIPVMDLRTRFNMPEIEANESTRIIIIKVDDISAGVIVDEVIETLQLPEESIENVTSFSADISMDYVIGVGKTENRIITLLNFEKLIKF